MFRLWIIIFKSIKYHLKSSDTTSGKLPQGDKSSLRQSIRYPITTGLRQSRDKSVTRSVAQNSNRCVWVGGVCMYFLRVKLNLREEALSHIIPMFITTQSVCLIIYCSAFTCSACERVRQFPSVTWTNVLKSRLELSRFVEFLFYIITVQSDLLVDNIKQALHSI